MQGRFVPAQDAVRLVPRAVRAPDGVSAGHRRPLCGHAHLRETLLRTLLCLLGDVGVVHGSLKACSDALLWRQG